MYKTNAQTIMNFFKWAAHRPIVLRHGCMAIWVSAGSLSALGLVLMLAGACALQATSRKAHIGIIFWAGFFHLLPVGCGLAAWRTTNVAFRNACWRLLVISGAMSSTMLMVATDTALNLKFEVCPAIQWA
jgi:hypothetical protein